MDLITVRETRVADTRDDLVFAPGELPLGGGTWLFSEPQPGLTGLVDLTSLDWAPIEWTAESLVLSATCTIATVRTLDASALFKQCADSMLASWKIQHTATIGGNVALGLPAGSMTSLCVALDAVAVIWMSRGDTRRMPVVDLVTGVQANALGHGEVVRALEFPRPALEARTGFRRISLSPLGRTATLVTGRTGPAGETVFAITGGTTRPHQFRFDEVPSAGALAGAVDAVDDWYDDPHGAPDWRRAMSMMFAEEIREELS